MGHMTPNADRTMYSYDLTPREPRTGVVSENRKRIIAFLSEKPRTFREFYRFVKGRDPYLAATQLLMINTTLGYGIKTNEKGRIEILPPKAKKRARSPSRPKPARR